MQGPCQTKNADNKHLNIIFIFYIYLIKIAFEILFKAKASMMNFYTNFNSPQIPVEQKCPKIDSQIKQ